MNIRGPKKTAGTRADVAAGGAIGRVARYTVSGALTTPNFPWGTFAVNFTGTFLLCFLFFAFLSGGGLAPDVRSFLFIGVLGRFTTFSTFGLDTVSLISEGSYAFGGIYVFLSVAVCLGGGFLGRALGIVVGGGG